MHHVISIIYPVFLNQQDKISKLDTADVINNIPCKDCTATYIGTTKRPLKTRIHEHKRNVYNPPDRWTASTKHAWEQDHTFNFNNIQTVDRTDNYKKRMILEPAIQTLSTKERIQTTYPIFICLLNQKK